MSWLADLGCYGGRGSDWIWGVFFLSLAMLNEVLESCEEWHSLIIPLIVPVLPHTKTSKPFRCANHLTGFHMRAAPPTINGVLPSETKELLLRSTYFQNLKCNVKTHVILVGIPSGLTSLVRNGEWGYYLNEQSPPSMTKVISINGPWHTISVWTCS